MRLGINGFGRIGRALFRILYEREGMEVVAINDIADINSLVHLLKYDSIHRIFRADIQKSGQNILIDGRSVAITHESQLENISWKGCDVVIEATGKFLTKLDLEKHINSGAKKVVLAAPPKGNDVKMVVLGVNDSDLNESDLIVSNASCTTNCAAPMVQIIDENFGVDQAYITTIHSYTKDQSLHDSPHKDLRRARAGALSIIPTTTGAAKAITKIFPYLEIGGCGIRVPVANGSLTDITFTVQNECTIEEINKLFYEASTGKYQQIVDYTEDPIVSADIVGNPASCFFDAQLTSVLGNMVKIVGWYDNEIGYSNRLADLIQRVAH